MADTATDMTDDRTHFLGDAQARLERALVVRFGIDDGLKRRATPSRTQSRTGTG